MTLSKEFVWSRVLQYRNFATFLVLDHVSPQTSPFSSLQVECTQPEGYRKGRSLSQLLNNLIKGCWKNSANVATEILKDSWRGNLSVFGGSERSRFQEAKRKNFTKNGRNSDTPYKIRDIWIFPNFFPSALKWQKVRGNSNWNSPKSLKSAGKFNPP